MIDVQAVTTDRWTPAQVAGVAYVVATGIGVLMRLQLVGISVPGRFDHLLHAHSHVLYFGWGALGLVAASAGMLTRPLGEWPLRVAGVLLVPLGVGFLWVGYAPITIAISTVLMFVWYAIAVGWWRRIPARGAAVSGLRGGVAYLVASTIGIWFLAVAQAADLGGLAEGLGVHAFLSGFGWFFVLAVTGLVLSNPSRFGVDLEPHKATPIVVSWIALAWLVFPLAVPGGTSVPFLGVLARVAGLLLVVPTATWARMLWRSSRPGTTRVVIRWSAVWLVIGVAGLSAVAVGGDAVLAAAGRQGVVIHLHALFVGYVTPLLALALAPGAASALKIHHVSLGVMLVGLTLVIGGALVLGMWIAAIAAGALWLAGGWWVVQIVRAR